MFTKYKRLAPPDPPDRDNERGEIYVNCSHCALDIEWSLMSYYDVICCDLQIRLRHHPQLYPPLSLAPSV